MPRLALINMSFGFFVLFAAAAAGAFIATDLTAGYVHDKALLDTWEMALRKSAHGHANLFGTLHVLFGLTLPYSIWSARVKAAQAAGLLCGTVAMGPVLLVRAAHAPDMGLDVTGLVVGALLSAALIALASHSAGIAARLWRRL